jgi:2'-5' RNA ligase
MTNRWESRAEPEAGQGRLYWHILFRDQPQVAALASIGQEKLSGFHGLHFTPREWLHITTFVPGLADEFTSTQVENMVAHARRFLWEFPPIQITLGKVFYHSEAIILGIEPNHALDSLRQAVWQATNLVTGGSEELKCHPWIPHITMAYSTADQPASPIINALGRELPVCKATVDSICLVDQQGAERLWNWRILAEIPFGAPGPRRREEHREVH